jgi:hypothetical protein
MKSKTTLALSTVLFLVLTFTSLILSLVNGDQPGLSFWAFLVITNVHAAAFHVVCAVTETEAAS